MRDSFNISLPVFPTVLNVELAVDQQSQCAADLIALVMRWIVELRVRQQWVQHTQIRVTQRDGLGRQVQQVPDEDVDQDMQVVGVEVLTCRGGREDEIEKLEREELEGSFA